MEPPSALPIADAINKLQDLIGSDLRQLADKHGVTVFVEGRLNKGWTGLVLEAHLGLPRNTGQMPNGVTWELKCVSVVRRGNVWVPKETMQITMINAENVARTPFPDSHVYAKLKRVVICAREFVDRLETTTRLVAVNDFNLDASEHSELKSQIERDYEDVRAAISSRGFHSLTGRMGVWIQPRTKGQKNSATRAFYARKALVSRMLRLDAGT